MMRSRLLERLGCGRLVRDTRGSMAVEFALLLPAMTALIFGATEFGVVMYNKIEMTDAARIAVRTLSIAKSSNTAFTDTISSFNASAPGIVSPTARLDLTVNGSPCTANDTCKVLLASGTGGQARVVATRPCRLFTTYLIVPTCNITSTSTARIE